MKKQAGFSAVELLITLFIAAIFVATGYQLYSVVITNGSITNQRAIASTIAYDNVRRYSPQTTVPCTTVSPSPTPTIPVGTSLPSPSITVTISCPYGTSSGVSKVEAKVQYATPQQEVVHAIYVNNE